jgi:hypothetical protein
LTSTDLVRACPYCGLLVMMDERGVYHQQPSCQQWIAEMTEIGATPGDPVHALVVQLDRAKGEPS